MRNRQIVVALNPAEYDRLAAVARREDRDPYQQARWMLRAALVEGPPPANAAEHALPGADLAAARRATVQAGGQAPA